MLSIEDQATIQKSTLVTNVIQQQRAYTMYPLATPCYNTIIEDQTNNMFQSNNEERKIAMIFQQTSPVNHKSIRINLAKLGTGIYHFWILQF